MGFSQIVIDCATEKTLTLLKQAQQLGMTGSYHSYLLTSLVIITILYVSPPPPFQQDYSLRLISRYLISNLLIR